MGTRGHCKAAPVYTHAELNIDRLLRDVEIDDRPFDVGKAEPDLREVSVLLLVHHEDPVGPQQQLPRQG